MRHLLKSSQSGWVYVLITLLIWSSFVVVSKVGGASPLTVFDIAAMRIAGAGLILSPWWVPRLFNPGTRKLKPMHTLAFSLLAGICYPLLAYSGFVYAPATHGSVLLSGVLPVFTTALMWFWLNEKPGPQRMLGVCLVVIGVAVLFVALLTKGDYTSRYILGDVLFVAASASWALFTVLIKHWQVKAFDVTLAIAALTFMIYLPVYGLFLPSALGQASWQQIALQTLFQGFFVPCLAMFTYAKAIELFGAVPTVIVLSSTPVVAMLMSVYLLGEPLLPLAVLASILVFAGASVGALPNLNIQGRLKFLRKS